MPRKINRYTDATVSMEVIPSTRKLSLRTIAKKTAYTCKTLLRAERIYASSASTLTQKRASVTGLLIPVGYLVDYIAKE